MRVGACMPTSWMENIKPASSLIVKPRCGGQGNALLIWLASAVMRWRLKTKQSDMNYEKKYKEIVGQIKKAYLYAQTDSTKEVLEEIFPELAESNDEKIRKVLIKFFSMGAKYNQHTDGIADKDIIAWLEKQGQVKESAISQHENRTCEENGNSLTSEDAIEREVKEDAGGYPYIDATELYDYENDKPLAKAGDRVKVVFIKDK